MASVLHLNDVSVACVCVAVLIVRLLSNRMGVGSGQLAQDYLGSFATLGSWFRISLTTTTKNIVVTRTHLNMDCFDHGILIITMNQEIARTTLRQS